MSSETPRTDAAMLCADELAYSETEVVLASFARELERSLAAVTAERDRLKDVLADFVQYVSPGDDVPLAAMLDDARAALREGGEK